MSFVSVRHSRPQKNPKKSRVELRDPLHKHALVVAATSAISAAATVVMFGNFSAGMRGASVEQLVLRRLLVDTSQEQLARVCSSIKRTITSSWASTDLIISTI